MYLFVVIFILCLISYIGERAVQVLCQISYKLLQIFCHLSLYTMSICNALLHIKTSVIFMFNIREDNDVWLKVKWMTLHFLETLLQLNEAGSHLVDTIAMTLVCLSHILKGVLSLLASPPRSLQRILLSTFEEMELVEWNVKQRKIEGEKMKMKRYVLKGAHGN